MTRSLSLTRIVNVGCDSSESTKCKKLETPKELAALLSVTESVTSVPQVVSFNSALLDRNKVESKRISCNR